MRPRCRHQAWGKARTYVWYRLAQPSDNSGENQICELDHLVSLELGGADTLDNILASVRTFQCRALSKGLQAKGHRRELSRDAGERGSNGPKPGANGYRNRLDSVP